MLHLMIEHGLRKSSLGQKALRLGKRVPGGLSGKQGGGLGCQEAGLGMSGWGTWLSLEGHGEQLVSRRGERLGTVPPAGARAGVQLSHTKT